MIRTCAFSLLALTCLVSCAEMGSYRPASNPETAQYSRTRAAINPDQVRANLDSYTNTPVAWVGIIRTSSAQEEDTTGQIRVDTVCDHHYYDWQQHKGIFGGVHLNVSTRGEGSFRCRWFMRRTEHYFDPELDPRDAEKYATPGKLAIFYGTPVSVDPDGTVVLKYHYIRVLPGKNFTTNGVTYGPINDAFMTKSAK